MEELKEALSSLESRLAKYDKDAKRNKKNDYRLMSKSELEHILTSGLPVQDKKKILLSQIGLLRINLFAEFSARIQVLEQDSRLDEAVELMNEYTLNVAIPFILKKTPSMTSRFKTLIGLNRQPEPLKYVQEWKSKYQSWDKCRKVPTDPRLRQELFKQLLSIYRMLYALSFSKENFPPSYLVIFYDPTRVRI